MEEYVGAKLDTKRPKKNLHKSKKLIKDCYDRNNSRNRDAYSLTKSTGMLKEAKEVLSYSNSSTNLSEVEDTIIAVLDEFNKKE